MKQKVSYLLLIFEILSIAFQEEQNLFQNCLSEGACDNSTDVLYKKNEKCLRKGYAPDAKGNCIYCEDMPLCGPEKEYGETIILYCVKAGYEAENALAFNYKCIKGKCTNPGACAFTKTACLTQGFVKNSADDDCANPSIDLCLETDYCYQQCLDFGFKGIAPSSFNFQLIGQCTLPDIDMCITDKICSEVCKQILKFSVDENNKCKLPENEVCEESNDKCSELCIHKGYLSDEKTNQCIQPTANECTYLYPCTKLCKEKGFIEDTEKIDDQIMKKSVCVTPTLQQCFEEISKENPKKCSEACVSIGCAVDPIKQNCIKPNHTECMKAKPCNQACKSQGYKGNDQCYFPTIQECKNNSPECSDACVNSVGYNKGQGKCNDVSDEVCEKMNPCSLLCKSKGYTGDQVCKLPDVLSCQVVTPCSKRCIDLGYKGEGESICGFPRESECKKMQICSKVCEYIGYENLENKCQIVEKVKVEDQNSLINCFYLVYFIALILF